MIAAGKVLYLSDRVRELESILRDLATDAEQLRRTPGTHYSPRAVGVLLDKIIAASGPVSEGE